MCDKTFDTYHFYRLSKLLCHYPLIYWNVSDTREFIYKQ